MRKLLRFQEEIQTFCADQAFVICFNSILLLILSFSLLQKSSSSSSKILRRRSPLHIFSLAFNGCLGSAYLFLGIWNLKNRGSLGDLIHGITWILISFFLSFGRFRIPKSSSKFLSVLAFLYSLLISGLSVREAVLGKPVSVKMVLDALFLPGSILLLFCSYKGFGFREIDEISSLSEPLIVKDDEDEADCGENVSSFARAGFFSKLAFWWLNPVMKRGWKKTLDDADIPKLRKEERSKTCYDSFSKKLDERRGRSILNAIFLCVWKDLLISGFFALVKILSVSAGPLLLNAFISVAEGRKRFEYEGYALVAFLFFCKILESLSQRHWYFRTRLIGLRLKSLLTAAIYAKQQRLSNTARLTHTGGEIMNYATVDAYRVGEFPFWFHQLWTSSLNLCIAFVILFNSLGPAAAAAMAVIILTVLLNVPIAKYQHKFQTLLMEEQDKRLKASTEALSNIKVLKLYAWDARFKSVIEKLRNVEYRWLRAVQLRKAYNAILFSSSNIAITTATLAATYLFGVPLNAGNFFTFLATLRIVQNPIRAFPDVIMVAIQANVAFKRIVEFLKAEERPEMIENAKRDFENAKRVSIKSASFSWVSKDSDPTIKNISLEIRKGEKVAVCGATAAGKSTLLAAILGEVPIIQGETEVHGRIAYVSQTAWTQTGTIRENILFGSKMEENRYKETIEKCCLVKDFDMLPNRDQTEIGGTGVSLSGGQQQRIQLARALYQDADLYLLDDPFSAVDAHTAASLFNEYVMGALAGKTVLLVTHQVDFLPAFDSILFMSNGKILQAAPYQEMLASSQAFQDLVNAHRKTAGSGRAPQITGTKNHVKEIKENYADTPDKGCDKLIEQEEKEKGHIGLKPYIQYLNQNKGFMFFFFAALSHLTLTIVQMLQKSWMAANLENDNVSMLKLILIYLLIGYSTIIFLFTKSLCTVGLCMGSSKSLFSRLSSSLFTAPMDFYDSTPLGRILSRVSNDLSIVDLDLPFSIIFVVGAIIDTGTALGLLSFVTWQVLLVCIPMVCLALFLQRYYFTTAKELMRINGTTKSLVANHLAESIAGGMTIRAFGLQGRFFEKNLRIIDANASPFFHSFTANEWLVQRLETLSAIVLASSALFMVLLPQGTFSSGFIGLALSYGLSLNTSLILTIQNHCYLANYIISVERLNQYMNIPKEAPQEIPENQPPPSWPTNGRVEISDLQIRYRPGSPLVLKGINCTIEGGKKIGIVGRTGSGKSTLINALFRLVEPEAGKILIDGIDISIIGLHDLRSRLAIIPQHPTLFTGTVRFNLDPLSVHSDAELWEVLRKCQLTEVIRGKAGKLDSSVEGEGSNWSMGQRQLFCLGRALLKKSRILVLDEATASVDNSTDLVLQRIIRREFADCTVITVAHRIPTVMDCSMVLSISNGEVVEYEEPMELMKKEGSLFGELVNEYWSNYETVRVL